MRTVALTLLLIGLTGCNKYRVDKANTFDNALAFTASVGKGFQRTYTLSVVDRPADGKMLGIYLSSELYVESRTWSGRREFNAVHTPVGYIFVDRIEGKVHVALAEKGTLRDYDKAMPINGVYSVHLDQ